MKEDSRLGIRRRTPEADGQRGAAHEEAGDREQAALEAAGRVPDVPDQIGPDESAEIPQ